MQFHIEIHQAPQLFNKPDGIYYKENTLDSWEVYLVNGKNKEKFLGRFDGFPILSAGRTDKSNQLDKAMKCAIDWCQFLGLKATCIQKFENKDSNYYKKFLQEITEKKDRRRQELQEELANL